MNSTTRELVKDRIRAINEDIIKMMMNPEKNEYDNEVQLPTIDADSQVVPKRKYARIVDTMDTANNRKRRESRPSTLEQCVLDGKDDEAEEKIRKMRYTAITTLSQTGKTRCNEKTTRKILKEMLAMVGYEAEMIPIAVEDEAIACMHATEQ